MTSKNHVDTGHPARKFQIHIHTVMGEQHNHLSAIGAHGIDHLLALFFTNTETPVFHHVTRIRERRIGKGLADDAYGNPIHLPYRIGFKHLSGFFIKRGFTLEGSILGQHDILRKELNRCEMFINDLPDTIHTVSKLPVPGHDVDPEQLARIDHVLTVRPKRCRRPLPGIASVQQKTVRPRCPEPLHQRRKVCETADLAVLPRCCFKVQKGEGMRLSGPGCDVKVLQKMLADNVWGLTEGISDPNIDVGFPKVHRHQLCVAIGEMQK